MLKAEMALFSQKAKVYGQTLCFEMKSSLFGSTLLGHIVQR
jgi:hypothetical protein